MKQVTFVDKKSDLTTQDIDQLVELLGYRCRAETCNKIRRRLESTPSLVPNYGIMSRLMLESTGWTYCAGQSYPDEIRTVRNIIINAR
jgi:hypothetical protein